MYLIAVFFLIASTVSKELIELYQVRKEKNDTVEIEKWVLDFDKGGEWVEEPTEIDEMFEHER